ncbi:hypothetical protein EZV73_12815 [Acidaminobacter sp. JC074]|uniref:S-layer homology domain-containing protein n=1 Tax=Acidaminobacter sp. JC074 TaxID=2530199 RepID=UPI001F118AC8|nr:S-layer homology domain-containing protein [Acidaminobacter sp. JC074]MCH4888466.1 hypothetical protein [Acidaminobacter sp. JC074]
MFHKTFKVVLILVMILALSVTSFAGNNIWAIISEAGEYEQAGELSKALPLWLDIIAYFDEQVADEGNHTNLAIFSKKVGLYYDSVKQYDLAVQYYEKENEHWLAINKPWGAEDMLRADEIRTVFEYYVEVDTKKEALEKYEPESGVYLGIYSENDKKIGQDFSLTKDVYGDHAMYILYQNWNQYISYGSKEYAIDLKLAEKMKDQGAGFHVAMNAMSGLDSVVENDWIIQWAKEAEALDMPIFLRFLGEMNGDWVPWNGNPELYKEKFKLVHDIMDQYAPNVVMVWTPNDVPVEDPNGIRIEDYYPGDEYVDWVGVNFYTDFYNSGNTEGPNNMLANPLSKLDYVYDLYADKKPIMIGETGIAHFSIPNQMDLTTWANANLKKFYAQLPIKYPRVKAINYFSLNQANDNYLVGNRWSNYALSENEVIQETYKTLIDNPYYLGNMEESYDKTYVEMPVHEMKEQEAVTFYIKITDFTISKVEFYGNGVLLETDTELPFSLETDFSKIDELTLKVYDFKGLLSSERVLDLNAPAPQEETPQGKIVFYEPFVEGYDDMSFRPNQAITRAELAAMLSRVIGGEEKDYPVAFNDLEDHWSNHHVAKLSELGIISGYEDGTFRPDQRVTKSELAAVFANYVYYANKPYVSFYSQSINDLDDNHWAVYAIRKFVDTEIFKLEDMNFNPEDNVLRKDVVYMLNRLSGRTVEGGDTDFIDLDMDHDYYDEIRAATTRQVKKYDLNDQ